MLNNYFKICLKAGEPTTVRYFIACHLLAGGRSPIRVNPRNRLRAIAIR